MTAPVADRRSIRPLLIVGVAVLCVAVLIGAVVREGYARSHGTEVTLSMRGVDPRDVVRGHYVRIHLVEDLPGGQVCARGEGKWISLQPKGSRWVPVGRYPSREQAQRDGGVAVRGTLGCTDTTVSMDIGVDRIYVNQSDATTIERAVTAGHDAGAIVSIGTDGRARLVGVDVDGRRYDLGW